MSANPILFGCAPQERVPYNMRQFGWNVSTQKPVTIKISQKTANVPTMTVGPVNEASSTGDYETGINYECLSSFKECKLGTSAMQGVNFRQQLDKESGEISEIWEWVLFHSIIFIFTKNTLFNMPFYDIIHWFLLFSIFIIILISFES